VERVLEPLCREHLDQIAIFGNLIEWCGACIRLIVVFGLLYPFIWLKFLLIKTSWLLGSFLVLQWTLTHYISPSIGLAYFWVWRIIELAGAFNIADYIYRGIKRSLI